MAVNDVAKLTFNFSLFGQVIRPGLHFRSHVALDTLADLINHFQATSQTAMLSALGADCFLVSYLAEDKVPGLAASVTELLPTPLPGLVAGACLPPADAVVFSLKSALKSPRSRGRVFWPAATEESTAGGVLQAAAIGVWTAFCDNLKTNWVGTTTPTGWELVTYSPEQLVAPKPPPTFKPRPGTVVTGVTDIVCDHTLRSQRRRQIGVGQ